MAGRRLITRVAMAEAELIDTINGLVQQGYIVSSKVNVQKIEDVERSGFRVNGAAARDLKEAMRPNRKKEDDRPRRRRG